MNAVEIKSDLINIVLLNWNSTFSTKSCLESILESDEKDFRIILINNYSTDADLVEMRKLYEIFRQKVEIYFLENSENLGYAGGNNTGLRFLSENKISGNILILNPDIILSVNTISEMKKALKDDIGIVSVRTLNSDGTILFDAIKLKGFFQSYIVTDKKIIHTDYSQGSCMLINRKYLVETGLFDDRFFLYWEEVDLSLRFRELSCKLVSVTSSQIIRKMNTDIREAESFYYSARNARLIKEKHPQYFSGSDYLKYILWMYFISSKFITRPGIFIKILANITKGVSDSLKNLYYSRSHHNFTK